MKIIGSELIHIVCIHTECTLTAIRFECAFSQSTSIEETSDKGRNNKCYFVASLW